MGIDLSQEELDRYLLDSDRIILCVSREGKAPLAVPMWFGWIEGRICMTTLAKSKKVGYLRKNPLVSCLVESGEAYFSLKAALLVGHCDIFEDPAEVARYREMINENKPRYKKLFPEKLPPHLEQHYAKPAVALSITPHGTTTWDFAKVRL